MSVDQEIEEFLSYYENRGIKLPDPEQYPACFAWYVKVWKYWKSRHV